MIRGRLHGEFGKGDVDISCSVDNGKGMLIFNNITPMEIGVMKDTSGESLSGGFINNSPMVLSFSNKASIDAFILALQRIRGYTDH